MTPEQLMRYYHEGMSREGGCAGPALTACLLLLLLLCGCKQTEYIPVKEIHTEYVHSHDTVHHTDTVSREKETIIREVNAGDSAMLAQYGIQLRENERVILFLRKELESLKSTTVTHSSDSVAKADTVPVPYPVPAENTAWEKVKISWGGYAMGAVLAGLVLLGFRIRKIFRE